ncbi:acyltransferase family protein [Halalkalibacterium ligniniphilum]|uniref:acyltransferase family protein n=1 Tax=Halalkalibacterium ligniniphilum TaxID=1134413 RepID=UPI00034B5B3B|nr:acyltransferase family protein [Halalkalibacterium ligniniphilum]
MEKRSHFFDNAKFILIVLVIFGHMISPYRNESEFLGTIYHFIYIFHMPAFILITGYFAKNYKRKGYLKNLAIKLLIPYLIFQLAYTTVLIATNDAAFTIFNPQWTLWFLISLFCWNAFLYVFPKKHYGMILALLLGLGIGYIDEAGTFLSISRTFVYFPIFLLGFHLKEINFKKLKQKSFQLMAAFVWLVIAVVSYYLPGEASAWLWGSKSYAEMGVEGLLGGAIRLLWYIASIIMMFAFLAFVPQKRYIFTSIGAHTLYIYLLHGAVIKLLRITPIFDWFVEHQLYILFGILALCLAFILASRPIQKVTKLIIEPKFRIRSS